MAPAAVEVDLGVGAGAAAGELEAGWRGGEGSTEVSSSLLKRAQQFRSGQRALRSACILLGSGVISTAVELVILVLVSSTRWYS